MSFIHKNIRPHQLALVQDDAAITQPDWSGFLAAIGQMFQHTQEPKILVYTEGGAPTQDQRDQLKAALQGRAIHVGVITEMVLPRMVVHAVSWFNPKIKAFRIQDYQKAFEFLGVDASTRAELAQYLRDTLTAVGRAGIAKRFV